MPTRTKDDDAEAPAEATSEQTATSPIRHRDGCPEGASRDGADPLETYVAIAPNGEPVTVVRCVDCGAQQPE